MHRCRGRLVDGLGLDFLNLSRDIPAIGNSLRLYLGLVVPRRRLGCRWLFPSGRLWLWLLLRFWRRSNRLCDRWGRGCCNRSRGGGYNLGLLLRPAAENGDLVSLRYA